MTGPGRWRRRPDWSTRHTPEYPVAPKGRKERAARPVAGSDSSSPPASTRTTVRARCAHCSSNTAGGSGCSASRTATRSSRSTAASSSTPSSSRRAAPPSAIRTAFMRRNLDDWERAEDFRHHLHPCAGRTLQPQEPRHPRNPVEARPGNPRKDLRERRAAWRPGAGRVGHPLRHRVPHDQRLPPLPAPARKWEAKGYRPGRIQPVAARRLAAHRRALGNPRRRPGAARARGDRA